LVTDTVVLLFISFFLAYSITTVKIVFKNILRFKFQ
jgi:hypothetical protein